jgi:hypothetical protein
MKGIQVCSNKGQVLFKGDIFTKMWWNHLKIFSRTTGPILIRLGTDHP